MVRVWAFSAMLAQVSLYIFIPLLYHHCLSPGPIGLHYIISDLSWTDWKCNCVGVHRPWPATGNCHVHA